MKASIIIPAYNCLEYTRNCIAEIFELGANCDFEIIVVDNGSDGEMEKYLFEMKNRIKYIRNESNLGFAIACNQGARVANGSVLVFLNNDTIPKKYWLDSIIETFKENPGVSIVGSKLLYPDGTIQHAGVALTKNLIPYHIHKNQPESLPAANNAGEIFAVTGACLSIRKDLFEMAGGFDEKYINGLEDIDLCLKVKEKGGKVFYSPKSVLFHLESKTQGRRDYIDHNNARFLKKWNHVLSDAYAETSKDQIRTKYTFLKLIRKLPIVKYRF